MGGNPTDNTCNEVAKIELSYTELPRVGDNLIIREPVFITNANDGSKSVLCDGDDVWLPNGRLHCEVKQIYRSAAGNVLDTVSEEDAWEGAVEVEANVSFDDAIDLLSIVNPEVLWLPREDDDVPYAAYERKAKYKGKPVVVEGPCRMYYTDGKWSFTYVRLVGHDNSIDVSELTLRRSKRKGLSG